MPYDIYGCRLRRGYCEVHPDVPEEWPCRICLQERHHVQREQEWPTADEYCAGRGHPPYAKDADDVGYCYCGEVKYPKGGAC